MIHLPSLIRDLAIILAVAGGVSIFFRWIKQPVVLGYILAGFLVGPHTKNLPTVSDLPNIQTLAELGVIFLLFSLGLEFSFRRLARVGGPSSIIGLIEAVCMMLIGFFVGRAMGWATMDSVFLGGILAISSTTIIIKTFDELGLKSKKFANVVFGVLIIEDLVAILLLIALTTIAVTREFQGLPLLLSLGKLAIFVPVLILLGLGVVPSFLRRSRSLLTQENLLLISVGLCLLLVLLATSLGYSAALGAFLMGAILAESSEGKRIEALIHPIKDLFGAVFFVSVGMLLEPEILLEHWGAVLLITAATVVGKIFSTGAGALLAGQSIKSSVQTGFSLAQIGEFSFIIATLGATLKVTSEYLYPITVAVALVTSFLTPYLIRMAEPSASWLIERLPKGWTARLEDYASEVSRMSGTTATRRFFTDAILRFLLNGILMTAVVLLCARWMQPLLSPYLHLGYWENASLIIALLLAGPFLWGMWNAFKRLPRHADREVLGVAPPVAVWLSRLAMLGWIGGLSVRFFSGWTAIAITLFFVLAGSALMLKRFRRTYDWFENHILQTLAHPSSAPEAKRESRDYRNLAPWDVQLAEIEVSADSELVPKTLTELDLRGRLGIAILVIERGSRSRVAPKPDERVLPADRLVALGSEEGLAKFRALCQPAERLAYAKSIEEADRDYVLKQILVREGAPPCGKVIRQSGLRENHGVMVVGLERGAERIANPDSSLTIMAGDVLWVVVDELRVGELLSAFEPA